MEQISEEVLLTLCNKCGVKRESLSFLGGGREDSDGIVYRYREKGKEYVLKILGMKKEERAQLSHCIERVRFANYLGEGGIPVACPISFDNGHLYEQEEWQGVIFVAYRMVFLPGDYPENSSLSGKVARQWGRLTGMSHRIAKGFDTLEPDMEYIQEADSFINWCKDETVMKEWMRIKHILAGYPKEKAGYAFIHNDNHQRNLIMEKNQLTLIDFDCARRQFFMQDIITPMQGLMFEEAGGMFTTVKNGELLKRFFSDFMDGYEMENHLEDAWYKKMDTFFQYRRLLLYTCMQDWIQSEPQRNAQCIESIVNPPVIF